MPKVLCRVMPTAWCPPAPTPLLLGSCRGARRTGGDRSPPGLRGSERSCPWARGAGWDGAGRWVLRGSGPAATARAKGLVAAAGGSQAAGKPRSWLRNVGVLRAEEGLAPSLAAGPVAACRQRALAAGSSGPLAPGARDGGVLHPPGWRGRGRSCCGAHIWGGGDPGAARARVRLGCPFARMSGGLQQGAGTGGPGAQLPKQNPLGCSCSTARVPCDGVLLSPGPLGAWTLPLQGGEDPGIPRGLRAVR